MLKNEIFIENAFLPAGSGGEISHIYPATGEINGTVVLGGAEEIRHAVAAAKRAAPLWESIGPTERRARIGKLADIVEAWEGKFRTLAAAEVGMPARSFAARHRFAVDWIRTYQGWADKIGGDVTASLDAGRFEYTRFEAYGVIGIVLTWNSALLSLTMKIPAALAAGNTVVVKPSEITPYTPLLFAQACVEAGIPAGVVNIVPGAVEAGETLVAHPDVEKISFTGGLRAASAMMRTGAPLVKPFCFELGGKSSHLVFSDADVRLATKVVCAGLSNAGQSCTFGSRIYVHESVYASFRAALVEHANGIVLGDPFDERTTMGPVVSAVARDRLVALINQSTSRKEAKLISGGKVPALSHPFSEGFFVEPAVFEDVDSNSALIREEIFGPVMSIVPFADEANAVAAANDTEFGLSNYVHTADLRRAIRVTAQLKSGTVYVNDASRTNPGAPFGGYRRSGIGYEGGRAGLDEFLRRKTVGLV
ncbi:MAG: aldehyde dehydrogenase family protein [Magnetospirillum sp.]|nr:aldehyde dehydrogenase family protein [Magnetospirillum sp.]